VRVTPKVGVSQVLRLLARAHGVHRLKVDLDRVGVAATADLSAVLAVLFAQEAETAMAAGPLRGYRSEEQTLPVLRGRVRLREQHLRRSGLPVPLEVTVDEWTLDTDENRRLRAATAVLMALPGVPTDVVQALLRLDRLLNEARLPARGAPLAAWTPTPQRPRAPAALPGRRRAGARERRARGGRDAEARLRREHGLAVRDARRSTAERSADPCRRAGDVPARHAGPFGHSSGDLVFYGPNGVTGVADTKCHVGITPTRRAGADDRARPASARLSTTQKVNVRGCHDEDIGTLDAAPHTGECRKPILSAVGKRACAARRC
jgi:5-methylcytosine-specific restriction enzyme subunit McrC